MFRPHIIQRKKTTSFQHPLKYTLKNNLRHKLPYIHNNINNPEYPKKNARLLNEERIKFAVVGNRVTSEYLECSHIVNALHKYRQDVFDTPYVRALTALEWSIVLKDLKVRYGGETYCIDGGVAVIVNGHYLGGEKELKEYLQTKFKYNVPIDHYNRGIAEFASFIESYDRTCVYMHLTLEKEYLGTFIFMLYDDIVPLTCSNFVSMCERKKGGYCGTSVHRIVTDGWIQCGGYGLKNEDIECENYIVPHDRRGVLCMANDGRHMDNSTQFFVLLQPAEWMAFKYVAFGQLIDGEETLKKIEEVPTWYEAPAKEIIIRRAGVLSMIPHDIPNKTEGYIEGHIEDLNALGKYLIDWLMCMFWLELEFRAIAKLDHEKETGEEEGEYGDGGETYATCHHGPTCKCVLDRMQEMDEQYGVGNESESSTASEMVSDLVESLPKRPYYIALTNIEDPKEIDSNYDLKRLLKGYYCLESDLPPPGMTEKPPKRPLSGKHWFDYIPPMAALSSDSLDTEENDAVKQYFGKELDYMSFGGNVIRGVAKSFQQEPTGTAPLRTSVDFYHRIGNLSSSMGSFDYNVGASKKKEVRIADYLHSSSSSVNIPSMIARRATGFVRSIEHSSQDLSSTGEVQTLLKKLYGNENCEVGPKLKDYVPLSPTKEKNPFLTRSTWKQTQSKEGSKDKFLRDNITEDKLSMEQLQTLNLQHGRKLTRKISSDYVKTMDTKVVKHKSIRSVQYERYRPTLTVSQYRIKVAEEQEILQKLAEEKSKQERKLSNLDHERELPTDMTVLRLTKTLQD